MTMSWTPFDGMLLCKSGRPASPSISLCVAERYSFFTDSFDQLKDFRKVETAVEASDTSGYSEMLPFENFSQRTADRVLRLIFGLSSYIRTGFCNDQSEDLFPWTILKMSGLASYVLFQDALPITSLLASGYPWGLAGPLRRRAVAFLRFYRKNGSWIPALGPGVSSRMLSEMAFGTLWAWIHRFAFSDSARSRLARRFCPIVGVAKNLPPTKVLWSCDHLFLLERVIEPGFSPGRVRGAQGVAVLSLLLYIASLQRILEEP